MSAIPGALIVPLVFQILVEMGHSEIAALLSASMILLGSNSFFLWFLQIFGG